MIPKNEKLYKKVKLEADKKFKSKTGIYKSSWIIREYKNRGGEFIGPKPKSSGLKRWYKEKWVNLNSPIKNKSGKIIGYKPCGRSLIKKESKYPLCRPTVRVSPKTPKTLFELSPKSIKKAMRSKSKIKHKGNIIFDNEKGGCDCESNYQYNKINNKMAGKPQFYGKRSDIMVSIPKNVKKWADRAFELHDIGFQGATKTGWSRAKQLSTKEKIPIEDLRYMRNWYARHIITSYPTFKEWEKAGMPKTKEWFNRRGIISWVTWGADAGFKWVNSKKVIDLLNKHFDKNYQKIKN